MNIIVLGASGMLGWTLFRFFSKDQDISTFGTLRSKAQLEFLTTISDVKKENFTILDIDIFNKHTNLESLGSFEPDLIINCIGLIKQERSSHDPISAILVNSLFPHQLSQYCRENSVRLIHFSTDCVFNGNRGNYSESDVPDAYDLYGRSKLLGEVEGDHALTLRTSILGHELQSSRSLVEWFLKSQDEVFGYSNAIFSGLPTIEIASFIKHFIIPNNSISGIYHLSSNPINKYDLLHLIAKSYNKNIRIISSSDLVVDRSLDCTRLQKACGYIPKEWPDLINLMRDFG